MTDTIESRIEKMLRVADGAANEHESATALALAQKLADAHNLDLGTIGKSGGREDTNVSKGLYAYQRTLYKDMGYLNHCRVWVSKGTAKGSKYTIRLLGSKVNVAVTKRICDYVEQVANRLVRENMAHVNYFSRDAHLYREGVIDRMVMKIQTRRREEELEREIAKAEQEARMRQAGAATENAIILMTDVREAEERANYDYLWGEGSWDRMMAAVAEDKRKREDAARELEAWNLANPEAAAKAEAEKQKAADAWERDYRRKQAAREKRRQKRIDEFGYDPQDYRGYKPSKYESRAYQRGTEDARDVSIDDQISRERRSALA
jgi:hypothetical protein